MEAFTLTTQYGILSLDPRGAGGACLYAEDETDDAYISIELSRLDLVALRDWLIAYTG